MRNLEFTILLILFLCLPVLCVGGIIQAVWRKHSYDQAVDIRRSTWENRISMADSEEEQHILRYTQSRVSGGQWCGTEQGKESSHTFSKEKSLDILIAREEGCLEIFKGEVLAQENLKFAYKLLGDIPR